MKKFLGCLIMVQKRVSIEQQKIGNQLPPHKNHVYWRL